MDLHSRFGNLKPRTDLSRDIRRGATATLSSSIDGRSFSDRLSFSLHVGESRHFSSKPHCQSRGTMTM